jgi:hypothetical protein
MPAVSLAAGFRQAARQSDTRLATIPADQLADKHGRDRPARV